MAIRSYCPVSDRSSCPPLGSRMGSCQHVGGGLLLRLILPGGPGDLFATGPFPEFQEALWVHEAVVLHQRGDEAGPAGLVAGTQARAVVAVEVLVEEQVVAPVRVGFDLLGPAIDRPLAVLVPQEDPTEPVGDL